MAANALILSESDLRPLLQVPGFMDSAIYAVERATVRFYQGKVRERNLVDQTQDDGPGNLLQIHFSADDDQVCGFQVFAETPGGPAGHNARYVALLDHQTRQLLSIVDYSSLNPLRVGASAGVGCRYLALAGARVAGILGSSKQARAQLQAIRRTAPALERVRVFSPTLEHRESFAREMTASLGLSVEAVATASDAAAGADIVGLANDSRGPLVELAWLKAGALVISIGSGQMPPEVMQGPRVVATTKDSLMVREPYASAIKAGTYPKEAVAAELGAVILGEVIPRRDPQEIVVFELSRINLWAVAIAQWAYQWAAGNGAGTPFALSADEQADGSD